MRNREHHAPSPAEVELHYHMSGIAAHLPRLRLRPVRTAQLDSRADQRIRRIAHRLQLRTRRTIPRIRRPELGRAHHAIAVETTAPVRRAGEPSAGGARLHFIDREDRVRLLRAGGAIVLADQSPRPVGAPEMLGAMHLAIDRAPSLMALTNVAPAGRASRYLVRPDNLVCAALAPSHAIHAEPATPARRVGISRFGVTITHDPAAVRASR